MSRNTGMTIVFQSTLPIQGETGSFGIDITLYHDFNPLSLYRERQRPEPLRLAGFISIHSPYTGRDEWVMQSLKARIISIHSPYTGRDPEWRAMSA